MRSRRGCIPFYPSWGKVSNEYKIIPNGSERIFVVPKEMDFVMSNL